MRNYSLAPGTMQVGLEKARFFSIMSVQSAQEIEIGTRSKTVGLPQGRVVTQDGRHFTVTAKVLGPRHRQHNHHNDKDKLEREEKT